MKAPDLAGRALDGRYELHAMIGEGSFGRVYRGLDRRLARPVAVKVIKPWWAQDSGWVERFEREAQLLARVSDPGIVQIFDIGHAEEGPYYVAELIEGESLAERLRRGPMPPGEARAVAEQLAVALASAHAQGVVHCDVKPANVLLLGDGRVKVGDFGVARLADGTSQAPSATVAGTPRYMSPEQARGRSTTPATDVYSAGVVLYEMLTGKPPFTEGSAVELGIRHLQDPPPPLSPDIPQALREVVARALAKDPAERYPDAGAMAAALLAVDSCVEDAAVALTPRPGLAPAKQDAEVDPAGTTRVKAAIETVALPRSGEMQEDATSVMRRSAGAPPPGRARRRGAGGGAQRRRRTVALGALAALVGGGLALLLLTGAAAQTTVPQLRGLPRAGVQARARRLHVQPALSARYSNATPGLAIAQRPAPGTRVPAGSTVAVVLSAGPPPVRVPAVVGRSSAAAETTLAGVGLRYGASLVAAPGSAPDVVLRQTPGPSKVVPHGSTVALDVAEPPRWRTLTSFSGAGSGTSVPFRILGKRWRVAYSMSYQETCLLLVVCMGPSAEALALPGASSAGSFELGEGSSQTHTFHSGPGLYRMQVSPGHDSARWSMTVEDYY